MSFSGKLCALAILGIPAMSLAQEATKPGAVAPAKTSANVDPAAEKLAAESEAAFRNAQDLSFEMTIQEKQGEKKASIVVVRSGPFEPAPKEQEGVVAIEFPDVYRVVLLGNNGEKMTEWSSNGKTLWKVDHAGKKVVSLELEQKTMPHRDVLGFFAPGLWFPVAPGAPASYSKIEGHSEVDGLKCRILKQVQEIELPKEAQVSGSIKVTTIRHIGPDLLPRKIETSIKAPAGLMMVRADREKSGPGEDAARKKQEKSEFEEKMVAVLTGLKSNSGLKPVDMATKTPEGYSAEKGTRAEMGFPSNEMPRLNAEVGKPAIAFSLKNPEGKEVTLASLKGNIVVLDFWATWCGPCKLAMPTLQKLHEKYAGKPVSIIGVNCMEQDPDEAVKYTKKEKFTYMQLLQGDELAQEYGVSGIPTLIVIDADGNVLGSEVGFSPELETKLSSRIDKALQAKPAPENAKSRR